MCQLDPDSRSANGGARPLTVALVADTHGYLDVRVAAGVRGCDLAVHAGDVGGVAVLDALRPRGPVHAVKGNNDTRAKWPRAEQPLLATLPAEVTLPLPGGVLVVVHGDRALPARRRHARLRAAYPDARAIVYGHSHRLCCDQEKIPWVVNPGAAGRSRTYGGPSFVVLRIEREEWSLETRRFEPLSPVRERATRTAGS
ncbi:MAG: metallophosphoesterase family protein [Gammaproteobacteria bacterium]|nr:metallophosphoesterase family protein [Gammaproteobacteria bacterium]NIR82108.1 metallophosphoesterase family protein [Gammaproteobacteria bacterium]NIR89341.1 metallophosphoesterase family protein [Gammaproteobacteria bacterium]NIU03218.1 metallophosphoesterase family protein [Gammaproteobacteria bacterium]NIV74513.1 metallophosphoesterase [Gammaproteobacteria bacterium]